MSGILIDADIDPLAPHSAQFPLRRDESATGGDTASEAGLRPWNLRRMTTVTPPRCVPSVRGVYDPVRQVRVDSQGRPVLDMGPPTAPTTGSTDGSEGDPSEDYHND